MMTSGSFLKLNAALRMAYGVGALLAPAAVARLARTPELEPDARFFNAYFGGRDLTVAAATLKLVSAGDERAAWRMAMSCELTDCLAWVLESRRRREVDRVVKIGAAFNAVGVLTCAGAALASRR